jgi:hypothetical protein
MHCQSSAKLSRSPISLVFPCFHADLLPKSLVCGEARRTGRRVQLVRAIAAADDELESGRAVASTRRGIESRLREDTRRSWRRDRALGGNALNQQACVHKCVVAKKAVEH